MTEPVITINGRALVEGQAMALRVAVLAYHTELQNPDHLGTDRDGRRLTHAYRDRLDEVIRLMAVTERAQQETMLSGMHVQRRNRILQLAGIVPEQATPEQVSIAEGYASSRTAVDEAAVRLKRAMDERKT